MTDPCTIPPPKAPDERVGSTIADRYRIDALVDEGAMGRVYVAEHVLMRKRVAIKVLHRELTTVPEVVARFEREAMAAANIDCQNVAGATDFGKLPDGAVYLVLELIEGKNLRDEIKRGAMPVSRSLAIARQIAYALKSAHALEIVHRDLKPENVMLVDKAGDPDFVKVLDFGIAKVPIGEVRGGDPDRPITKAGMVFGTPEYMAPEQALGQTVDARADLYALGVITYEMLAGCRPFAAESSVSLLGQQLSHPAPGFAVRAPEVVVPPGVERFVLKMLEREPAERYASAQEVLDEIDSLLGHPPGRRKSFTLPEGSPTEPAAPEGAGGLAWPEAPPSGSRGGPPQAAPLRPEVGTLGSALSRRLDALTTWVDGHRDQLPAKLRELPAPVLLAAPASLVGVLVGVLLVSALGGSDSETSPTKDADTSAAAPGAAAAEARPLAPKEELADAAEKGLAALLDLAKRYPEDASIRVALSAVHLKNRDFASAVRAIGEALALDPQLKNDEQIASALWITSQRKETLEATLELLAGPMGDRGEVILQDLVATESIRPNVRQRAGAVLAERKREKGR